MFSVVNQGIDMLSRVVRVGDNMREFTLVFLMKLQLILSFCS